MYVKVDDNYLLLDKYRQHDLLSVLRKSGKELKVLAINSDNCFLEGEGEEEIIAFGVKGKECRLEVVDYNGNYSSKNCSDLNDYLANSFLTGENGAICFSLDTGKSNDENFVFKYLGEK